MKLTKNLKYLVRVRDYETVHVEVGAEISHYDLGYDDAAWVETAQRPRLIDQMRATLDIEVDRLAREELETIAEWSEISPNLAEDFLSEPPAPSPADLQRKHHAKTTSTQPSPSGGIRRSGERSPSPRPLRPA